MAKQLNKEEREYIHEMNLWYSIEKNSISTYVNDNNIGRRIINLNNSIIELKAQKITGALKDHNEWRRKRGLKPIKQFKYISA